MYMYMYMYIFICICICICICNMYMYMYIKGIPQLTIPMFGYDLVSLFQDIPMTSPWHLPEVPAPWYSQDSRARIMQIHSRKMNYKKAHSDGDRFMEPGSPPLVNSPRTTWTSWNWRGPRTTSTARSWRCAAERRSQKRWDFTQKKWGFQQKLSRENMGLHHQKLWFNRINLTNMDLFNMM